MAVKPENLPFEKALERLEGIVEKLESGSVALADSVKLFEEGIALRKRCLGLLQQAETKIKFLTTSTTGEVAEVAAPDEWEAHDNEG